jgi:hypothetical protein
LYFGFLIGYTLTTRSNTKTYSQVVVNFTPVVVASTQPVITQIVTQSLPTTATSPTLPVDPLSRVQQREAVRPSVAMAESASKKKRKRIRPCMASCHCGLVHNAVCVEHQQWVKENKRVDDLLESQPWIHEIMRDCPILVKHMRDKGKYRGNKERTKLLLSVLSKLCIHC